MSCPISCTVPPSASLGPLIGTLYLQDPECLGSSENDYQEAQYLHQLCLQLRTAAENLPQGKEGEDYDVCTVGSKQDPTEGFGGTNLE